MVLSIRSGGRPAVRPSGLLNEVLPVLSSSSTSRMVSAYGAPAPLFHLGAAALAVVGVIERPVAKLVVARTWLRRRPAAPDESESAQEPKDRAPRALLVTNRTRYGEGPEAPDPGRAAAQSRARDRRPDVAGPVPPPTRDDFRRVVLAPPAFRRSNTTQPLEVSLPAAGAAAVRVGAAVGLGSASRAAGW